MMREQEKLCQQLVEEHGYLKGKVLPDGSLAFIQQLAFTRAILLGTTKIDAYERRFCFENVGTLDIEWEKLTSALDVPTGWVASRPQAEGNGIVNEGYWKEVWLTLQTMLPKEWHSEIPEGIPHPREITDLMVSLRKSWAPTVPSVFVYLEAAVKRRLHEMRAGQDLYPRMVMTSVKEVLHVSG